MSRLVVTDRVGVRRELDAVEGWRVMEILREHGVGVDGLCGGACACASCHVIVDAEWAARLHPADAEELDKLDELPVIEPTSRLSCQIIWAPSLDGLVLTLPQAM